MKYYLLLTLLILPFSCSTFKDMGQNQTSEGHFRLYTYPEKVWRYLELINKKEKEELKVLDNEKPRYEDIILVAINDFNGKIAPTKINYLDRAQNTNHEITLGGIAGYKAYFEILRNKFKENVHIISSGSLVDSDSDLREVIFYMNYLGIDVAGIGIGDFSINYKYNYMSYLDEYFKQANFTPLLSNAFNLRKNEQLELEHIFESTIIKAGRVQIGYINLIAPSAVERIPSEKTNGIYFEKLPVKMIKLSNKLRKKGADIVVAMISEGIDCTSQQAQALGINEYKVNFLEVDTKVCNKFENQTIESLKQLPPDYIDAIVTNGKNSKVANYFQGYPVIQNFANGTDFSWLKLTYDHKLKRLDKKRTQILQPVSTCHNFFKETEDCYTQEVLRNVELTKAKFLNHKIKIQPIPTHK
tara:strand:+ start:24238 stop:25479 length:1242 start_codon:yes stop_codon:yes gene_type:complete